MRKRDEGLAVDDHDIDEDKDPRFVTALARGLDILRSFRRNEIELGNQDLAARTGLPKATVSRLTYTLGKQGYLVYNAASGKYRLGTPVLSLGYTCLSGMGVRQVARPLMQELADHTGLSVALGGRDRFSMIYLECCRGDSPVTLQLDVGSHLKLTTSAMGRAYLAGLPDTERAALMDKLEAHENERSPGRWPGIRDGILQAVEEYRMKGYCLSLGAWKTEVNAAGVPYVPRDGSPVLAFNCGGPSFLLHRKTLEEDHAPRLVELVRRIDAALFNS